MTRIEVTDLREPLSVRAYSLIGTGAFVLVFVVNIFVFKTTWVPALINALVILVFPIILAVSNHKRYKELKNAFVSWTAEEVHYNTTKGEQRFRIDEMVSGSVSFDQIDIKLKNGTRHRIILDIFSDVQDRNTIKNFFGQLAL